MASLLQARCHSPRTNIRRVLAAGSQSLPTDEETAAACDFIVPIDAENKLRNRKLYLVFDLDETLYSKRMEAGATPVGTQIHVRGSPFDMVQRPGLQHFLRTLRKTFVLYLYTMGDQDYTEAALRVIDPDGKNFTGGILAWRPTESRNFKNLSRCACDPTMSLIVDDSIDVWEDDLPNFCLTRRFMGDPMDDGLQVLAGQLMGAHRGFYEGSPADGFSLEAADAVRAPPSIRDVVAGARGQLFAGCVMALTGVVADQSEDNTERNPLCQLIRQCGGEITLQMEHATHLVARKKPGWTSSTKIRRALARAQAEPGAFHVVWDDWLLFALTSWQRQPEDKFAIPSPEGGSGSDDGADAGAGGQFAIDRGAGAHVAHAGLMAAVNAEVAAAPRGRGGGEEPPRKRPREAALADAAAVGVR